MVERVFTFPTLQNRNDLLNWADYMNILSYFLLINVAVVVFEKINYTFVRCNNESISLDFNLSRMNKNIKKDINKGDKNRVIMIVHSKINV